MKQPTAKQAKDTVQDVETVPWHQRPHNRMKVAGEVSGISEASLYRLASEGRLKLLRLAGRTLVETASLIALIESAEAWTPSNRGAAARAKRAQVARSALRR